MKRSLIETMLSFSSEACIILDRDLRVVAVNDLAQSMVGLAADELLSDRLLTSAEVQARLAQCFGSTAPVRFLGQTRQGAKLNLCGWRLSGALQRFNLIAVKLEDSVRINAQFVNLTAAHHMNQQRSKRLHEQKLALEQQNQILVSQAERDAMTGLLNAGGLRRVLQTAISDDQPFSLFYIDMNGLKAINDSLGHDAGDQAITTLAEAIRRNSRQCDHGARLGGDEFALMVTNVTSRRILREIGEAISVTLAQHSVTLPGNRVVNLSAAIGVARFPRDGRSIQSIESYADRAMYVSKRAALTTVIAGDAIMRSLPRSPRPVGRVMKRGDCGH